MARKARGLADLIHPELGIFVVHNIGGSVPQLELLEGWPADTMVSTSFDEQTILEELAQAERWEENPQPPDPEEECGEPSQALFDAGSALGWVLDVHLGLPEDGENPDAPPWITRDYEDLVDSEGGLWISERRWSAADWSRLQTLNDATVRGAYVGSSVALLFGSFDGRWYLIGIDGYDDACG